MEAILFVGHGSKDQEGNEELMRFTDKVAEKIREKLSVPIIETCFLELTTPTVSDGIKKCVNNGATKIALVPIILFSAGHAKLHIPHEIDQARKIYPNITFTYGRPIAVHEGTLKILENRLEELGFTDFTGPRRDDTALLLVGRGSSDPDANSEFFKILRLFWERIPVKWVEPSFMGITEPTFHEGIERLISTKAKNIYVLPYFLFTGVLIKRMDGFVDSYRKQYPELNIRKAQHFGFHELLIEVIKDRAVEALYGQSYVNCDMCHYRFEANHDHNHQHEHDVHHHSHHHEHFHNQREAK